MVALNERLNEGMRFVAQMQRQTHEEVDKIRSRLRLRGRRGRRELNFIPNMGSMSHPS